MDDPFASVKDAAPAGQLIRAGRYRLPNRDGSHHPGGWMRVSNLVSAYVDQYALRQWEQRQVMTAIRRSHELYTELVEATEDQVNDPQWDERFLEKCKGVAGGRAGAEHGTQRHSEVEGFHRGDDVRLYPSEVRRMLALYASTLERHKLTPLPGMQERRVLISSLGAVGTLDNVVREETPITCGRCEATGYDAQCPVCHGLRSYTVDGANLVADLKTQRKFWEYLYIRAQLACYAHGEAMWDPAAGVWVDMPVVRQDVALVLWMPRGSKTVDVLEVDIVAGWRTAQRAFEVVQDRQGAKKGGAWLRPAPPVTEVERYAAMFAGVDSRAEGTALVAECERKGIWCEALADSARLAMDRLTKNMVR